MHCYDWAVARRPALLCLHGMASCGLGFAELAARLGGHYRVIAPDLPGHGETPPFPNEAMYRFSRLAVWLDAVVRELVDEPFYLLGHSWGAAIALHYAARYPERVRGLILLDGGLDQPADVMPLERALELWASYIESARFPGWEEAVASMRGYTRRWSPLLEQAARAMFRPRGGRVELVMERATAEAILRAFYEEPFRPLYGAVRARILCLHGGEYPAELQPARREALAALRQQAAVRVIEIAGAGHRVNWDEPDRVAAAIHAAMQDFLDPSSVT